MFEKPTVRVRDVLGALLLGTVLLAQITVLAYPNRPIKIIVAARNPSNCGASLATPPPRCSSVRRVRALKP